ncbi:MULTISPECIES: hypothetical protein [unclassified Polaribacter]|jgi:hypothetical protein|nr:MULTISPECIES: hypothetical protein [unclassified Polaribacter]
MEEIINDFSAGILFWQVIQIVFLAALVYFLYKISRRFSKK